MSPRLERRERLAASALVFAAAVLAQLWILRLPFQLDDYLLLAHPLRLFDVQRAYAGEDVAPFALRWPLWALWALVRAVAGEPLSPLPFHAVALLLHGCVAVLLARCVDRLAPRAAGPWAGTLAGLAFGLAAGDLAAVSWTAAGSDLLLALFALLALALFLRARGAGCGGDTSLAEVSCNPPARAPVQGADPPGWAGVRDGGKGGRWGALGLAFLVSWLLLVTKTPGVLVLAAVGVVLAASALAAGVGRAFVRRELPALGIALAAGLVCRVLYLGSLQPRYHGQEELGPLRLLAHLPQGLVALGQALYPWSADPLFRGDEPLLARLLALPPGSAPIVGWAVLGLVVLAAVLLAPATRRTLGLLAVALVPCVLPLAALATGRPDNILSRLAYVPMLLVCAAAGIALAALFVRRRGLAALLALLLLAILADGTLHVRRTERLAAHEIRASLATLQAVRAAHAASGGSNELCVLAIRSDSGFGGIPVLGPHLDLAVQPPFAAEPIDVRLFTDGPDLARRFPSEGLAPRDVVAVGPAVDDAWRPLAAGPLETGEENRARRELRWLTPLCPAPPPDAWPGVTPEPGSAGGSARWHLSPALAPHSLAALAVSAPSTSRGELRAGSAGPLARYELGPGGGGLSLEPGFGFHELFGPPLQTIEWRGEGTVPALEPRPALPALALAPADEPLLVPIAPGHTPAPSWRCTPPAAARRLRLELWLRGPVGQEALLVAERELPAGHEGPVGLAPGELRVVRPAPPAGQPPESVPWGTFASDVLLPELLAGRLRRVTITCRASALTEDGVPLARSPLRTARLVLAAPSATEGAATGRE